MYDVNVKSSIELLEERKDAIINYLEKNTHLRISKQMVIKAITTQGKGSRKTILRELNALRQEGVVYIRQDKPNSQTHWVSLNSDSEVRRSRENIRNLRDTFFELIQKANTLPNESDIDAKSDPDMHEAVTLAENALITLFEHLVGIYMLYFILEWPKKVSDPITRQELYTITFQKIQEIQIQLLKKFPHPEQVVDNRGMFIEDLFILKEDRLQYSFNGLKRVGFGEQAEALLDQLWKFSSPFVPDAFGFYNYSEGKDKSKFQKAIRRTADWRRIVQEQSKSRRLVHREAVEIITKLKEQGKITEEEFESMKRRQLKTDD